MVKNSPDGSGGARDAGLIPGLEDPLETEMANHSSVAKKIIIIIKCGVLRKYESVKESRWW